MVNNKYYNIHGTNYIIQESINFPCWSILKKSTINLDGIADTDYYTVTNKNFYNQNDAEKYLMRITRTNNIKKYFVKEKILC